MKEQFRVQELEHKNLGTHIKTEAKTQAAELQKELQKKSAELSSSSIALEEARREHMVTEQQAEALEKTCQLLRSECNSAGVLRGKQQDEHRRQLESLESQAHALELQRRRLGYQSTILLGLYVLFLAYTLPFRVFHLVDPIAFGCSLPVPRR